MATHSRKITSWFAIFENVAELNEVCNGSEAILETHFESVGLLGEEGVKGVGIKCSWDWESLYKPEIWSGRS